MTAQDRSIFDFTPANLERFQRGERLGARKMNANTIDAMQRIVGGLRAPRQVHPGPRPQGAGNTRRFLFVSVHDDHLVCKDATTGEQFLVAKNWWLRRNPFDESDYVRAGETFTYINASERVVKDANAEQRKEIIYPTFEVDDVIIASSQPVGGTQVSVGGIDLVWQDANDTARTWLEIIGGGGLILGGRDTANDSQSTVWSYLPDAWKTLTSAPVAMWHHAAATLGVSAYVAFNNGDPPPTATYRFLQGTWSRRANSTAPSRSSTTAESNDEDKVYFFGGQDPVSFSLPPYSTNSSYKPETNTWNTETAMDYRAAYVASFLLHDDDLEDEARVMLHVCGGDTHTSGVTTTTRHDKFDTVTRNWISRTAFPSPSRYRHAGTHLGESGHILGGFNESSGRISNNSKYSPLTDSWAAAQALPIAVDESAAFTLRLEGVDYIYIAGGFETAATEIATVRRYVPDAWNNVQPLVDEREACEATVV